MSYYQAICVLELLMLQHNILLNLVSVFSDSDTDDIICGMFNI